MGCAAEGTRGVISNTAVINLPPLLLCRKSRACPPADSAGALEPSLAEAVGIAAETLEPIVVCFCCYSCHNHASRATPGSYLHLRATATAAAAAAVRGQELTFLKFWAFCLCHF